MVSHVLAYDKVMRYGAGRIRFGAIGDVATDPEHRRRGHAAKLLENAVDYMKRNDLPLSLLYTGTKSLYEGWAGVWSRLQFWRPTFPPRPGPDLALTP